MSEFHCGHIMVLGMRCSARMSTFRCVVRRKRGTEHVNFVERNI